MAKALLDSNVVVGARMASDQHHDRGDAIVEAVDAGDLPACRLLQWNVPEITTPIERWAGDAPATETLEFLLESRGIEISDTTSDDFRTGCELYLREAAVELVDCIMVAYMRRVGIDYCYSFDDDFDRFDDVTRLSTPDHPGV